MAELNYKAIVTIPAWASRMLEGDSSGEPDRIETTAKAYTYVPLIRRAVRLRCNSLARPRLVLRNQRGDEVDWPFETKPRKLLWNTEASLLLMGAGYNEKILRARSRKVLDLKWVNPTSMIVSYDGKAEDELDKFKFQQGEKGSQWTLRDMVYMREFALADDVMPGDSAAKNALTNAGLTRFMSRFASTFFEKGAMPLTIVSVEGLTDKDEVARMQKGLRKMMTGIRRAFNLVVLNKSLETKVLTQPLKDMVFPDLYDQAVVEVAHAFEIPEAMLTSANNRSVTEEHRLSFWQDTIQPRGEWMADQYNEQVFDGMGLTAEFAFDELDVFQEDETKRSTSVETLTRAISTDAEAALFVMKNILGYELSDEQLREYDETFLQKPEPPAAPPPPPQPGQFPPQDGQEPQEPPQPPQPPQGGAADESKAVKVNENSAMIALKIPEIIRDDIRNKYPFIEQEVLDNLHITLIYLGDVRTLNELDIVRALYDFSTMQAPIKGKLQGIARFVSGNEKDPIVLTFDSPQMPGVYSRLAAALDMYRVPYHKEHGFIPHMTLAYIDRDAEIPVDTIEPIEINFSSVFYVSQNAWMPVEFTGNENKSKQVEPEIADEPPQPSLYVDLEKWRRKAIKQLDRGKPAKCAFESEYISDEMNAEIREGLEGCETAEQVCKLFAGYAEAGQEAEGSDDIKALVKAIELEVMAIQRNVPPFALTVHNYPGEKPEVKVENQVHVPPTEMKIENQVHVPPTEMKIENQVHVPEQAPPVVQVINEVQPADVTINTPRNAVLKDANGRVIRRLQAD